MSVKVFCFHCKKTNELSDGPVGRREECQFCRSDIHVCKNCQMYNSKSYNECNEPSADVVKEKERANFCDYFSPQAEGSAINQKDKLLSAAEALFKKT